MTPSTTRIKTQKEQHVDLALSVADHPSLEVFVADRRPEMSWPDIAYEVRQITGIAVPEGTLRRWFIPAA
ncbi:MAG: hypothetical protein AAGE88_18105 [Actinomycetota bacterium]